MSATRGTQAAVIAAMVSSMVIAQEHQLIRPVSFTQVKITDAFWAPRLEAVLKNTLPHCFKQCEDTGRLRNFDKAAGKLEGKFEGYFFNDSDVYKVIEGAAYALMHRRDSEVERTCDEIIARILAAQQPNGYLNSYFSLTPSEQPWSNTKVRHELYCAGHMIEAALAYYEATGKRDFLDAAIRFVDHIADVFGPNARHDVPGHEEIELALIKLYYATNEQKYFDLARFFVEQRGHADGRELYGEYCQDHAPVRTHTQIVGHAVRAMYLYCAAADLAAAQNDPEIVDMLERVWRDTIDAKMYVTGGIGPSSDNEGFTVAYDLPNDSAYSETCASIGMALWNHRLNLLSADARYADVLERVLYNALLAGMSLDGTLFFYTNPLGSRGTHHRKPWYACACCPTNVVRFIPSVAGYIYAQAPGEVFVNLYIASDADIPTTDGPIQIRQETRYPWDGAVRLTLKPRDPRELTLALRIPEWCAGEMIRVNGTAVEAGRRKGYALIQRKWKDGDVVELDLPMPVQRIEADPRVEANRGRVALQRGPVIYCLEAADNTGGVRNLALSRDAELTAGFRGDLLGGVGVITGTAQRGVAPREEGWDRSLYNRAARAEPAPFTAIPYFAWDNREAGDMVTWLPESLTLIDIPPVSWVKPSASHVYERDSLAALNDRLEPKDSSDHSIPRATFWPNQGTREWVQYDFDSARPVSGVAVYWFDDSMRGGGSRAPKSWKLLYRAGDQWREVRSASVPGVALDTFNEVGFEPVRTDGLRIEVELDAKASAGLLEWKILLAR